MATTSTKPALSPTLLRADDVAPQPWRNGGGRTRELLAWPPGPDWQLRISLADIEADGPFSPFPGVQRWFAVIAGAGVVLALPGGERWLTTASEPLCFDGGEAPGCRLVAGPTRDLNLMLRGGARGCMARAESGAPWTQPWRWHACFTSSPARWHGAAGHCVDLEANTLLCNLGALPGRLVATGASAAVLWMGADFDPIQTPTMETAP